VPGAKIGYYWDTLDNLLPLIKEGKIASDITVTVRYKDLNLNPLEHNWDINPRLYEGIRNVDYSGMMDLVDVIDGKIADDAIVGNSSLDQDASGGAHPSKRSSKNAVKRKANFHVFTFHALRCIRLRKGP
jgi:hypothetical protein